MNRRGLIGVAVLWILAAVTALGFAAIRAGRGQAAQVRWRADDLRATHLAAAAARIERSEGFPLAERTHVFETGAVRVTRSEMESPGTLTIRCGAASGQARREIDIGFRKTGDRWECAFWREPS